MANPLRFLHPGTIVFVSNRCVDEMLLLRPSPKVNALILACLARAVAHHGVELIGFVFMGNHFHLIMRVPRFNLGDFMRDFQSWLVLKLKKLDKRIGKLKGSLFPERYSQVDILDDAKAFDKLIYTLVNPCKADLVARPEEYPGISSLPYQLTGEKLVGRWVDLERYNRNRKRNADYQEESAASYHEVELTPLPQMKEWNQERRRKTLIEALEKRCEELDRERERKAVLGAKGVLAASPTSRPKNAKFSAYKSVLSTDKELEAIYEEARQNAFTSYRAARRQETNEKRKTPIEYPGGMYKPGAGKAVTYSAADKHFLCEKLYPRVPAHESPPGTLTAG